MTRNYKLNRTMQIDCNDTDCDIWSQDVIKNLLECLNNSRNQYNKKDPAIMKLQNSLVEFYQIFNQLGEI